jgi:DNA-binding MarR family transcriptional regulator
LGGFVNDSAVPWFMGWTMSFQAMTWAWQQKVSPTQKLVLLALADRADACDCYVSVTRMIRETGLTLEKINQVIEKLEKQGLVISQPPTDCLWIRCRLLMIEVK